MDKKQQIESLIKYLEIVRQHPKFHFGDSVPPVVNFLWGFHLPCHALNLTDERDKLYNEVQLEHGWEISALHLGNKLVDEGLDEAAIINELLKIEIEVWQRVNQQD